MGVFISVSLFVGVQSSAAVSYCSETGISNCTDFTTDLGVFLEEMADRDDYYEPPNFEIVDGFYVVFTSENFEYYVPFAIVEAFFSEDDYYGEVTEGSWRDYDEDQNLIHDDFDNLAEEFEDVYDRFDETYHFDLWWDSSNRLPVVLSYIDEYTYGYFAWGDSDDYLDNDPPHMLMNVFVDEEALIGTVVHEMFHAVQYGYVDDMSMLSTSSFAEATATMMESKYPGLDDLSYMTLQDVAALEHPEYSVFGSLTDWTYEGDGWRDDDQYGAFLWYSFLHQEYGKDVIVTMLEAYQDLENEFGFDEDLVSYYSYLAVAIALEEEGVDVRDAYVEFTIELYDKDDFADADLLPDLSILNEHDKLNGTYSVDEYAPALFGSNLIWFDVDDRDGYLSIDITGNIDALYYVTLIPISHHSIDRDGIEEWYVDYADIGNVNIPIDDYDEVVMIVSPVEATYTATPDFFQDYVYPYIYTVDRVDEVDNSDITYIEDTTGLIKSEIFSDVFEGDQYAEAIEFLKDNAIIGGYPDGSFQPYGSLNRAELLKILVEGAGITPSEEMFSNCFSDVTDDWYAKYVCYAEAQGWVEGYSDGSFKPAQEVNKVEAIKMMLEVFDVDVLDYQSIPLTDVVSSEWYASYIYTAYSLSLLEEESGEYGAGDSILRGEVSENLYRLLVL